MKFSKIVEHLNRETSIIAKEGNDPEIIGVSAIEDATLNTISYIEGKRYGDYIQKTSASALILPQDETLQAQADAREIPWLAGGFPRLLFARIIDLFYTPFQPAPAIHPSAVIDPSAVIQENVYIGPNVVIYPNVKISSGVCIYANVVIYPEVEISDRAIIHANATVHERTRIGKDCIIHSNTVIGGEGFGFVPTFQGWYKMQQSGRVVLEEGVEVGSTSTIDRPAVGETRIRRNTKFDDSVHIGHGCQVGENCAFAAKVALAGGVKVGNNVLLGGQSAVANQVRIGDGARATGHSGITHDVKSGEIVSGSPAVSNRIYLRSSAIYKRLPEMYKTLKRLIKQESKHE